MLEGLFKAGEKSFLLSFTLQLINSVYATGPFQDVETDSPFSYSFTPDCFQWTNTVLVITLLAHLWVVEKFL